MGHEQSVNEKAYVVGLTKAFIKGRKAALEGINGNANPYSRFDYRTEWFRGWRNGMQEAMKRRQACRI